MDSLAAIQTFNLTRKFGEMTALNHLNLTVEAGKIFGLLGPNGAGKSTAIKMLTTLLEPSSGSAKVAGFDIVKDPTLVRAHIGYVPQMVSADGALTGQENLLLSARLYGIPRVERNERIQESLRFMQLEEAAGKLVKNYSGGMIRRLELAQAILHQPAVLFLDEPTIGLDPTARHLVWDHLKDMKGKYQLTVLITTHDMEEANDLCDELAFLHQGKIAGLGNPAELKAALGPNADLDDVFSHFSGTTIDGEAIIVTSNKPALTPVGTVKKSLNLSPSYGGQVWAIADVEFRKMLRDPTEIFSRAVQPILWLLIFGQVFSKLRDIPTGGLSYMAFMVPGVLAQSVLFCAIFYGINVIWEKDMGVIHKLLVSPASRSALVLGKALSSGFRGLVQAGIIYLMAFLLHIGLNLTPLHILGVLAAVVLGSAIFSTFSLIIACLVKSRDRFMGIGQVLTMPLFFASSAIYPIAMMPDWLKMVAQFNPLTYLVDAMRTLMIQGAQSVEGLGTDFAIMTLVFIVFIFISTRLYPNLIR